MRLIIAGITALTLFGRLFANAAPTKRDSVTDLENLIQLRDNYQFGKDPNSEVVNMNADDFYRSEKQLRDLLVWWIHVTEAGEIPATPQEINQKQALLAEVEEEVDNKYMRGQTVASLGAWARQYQYQHSRLSKNKRPYSTRTESQAKLKLLARIVDRWFNLQEQGKVYDSEDRSTYFLDMDDLVEEIKNSDKPTKPASLF